VEEVEVPPIIEAATKRSGVIWLDVPGADRTQLAWYVWHEGCVYVVHGGIEQAIDRLDSAREVAVSAKSKDTGGRVVCWVGDVERVLPGSAEWESAVPVLHAARLNPPDGEGQPARWARESVVTRIRPTGELLEEPGALSAESGAAEPTGSSARSDVPLPRWLGRPRYRRPLG
jgi:hypothetical protein